MVYCRIEPLFALLKQKVSTLAIRKQNCVYQIDGIANLCSCFTIKALEQIDLIVTSVVQNHFVIHRGNVNSCLCVPVVPV